MRFRREEINRFNRFTAVFSNVPKFTLSALHPLRHARTFDHIQEAVAAIRKKWSGTPQAGIILGTGLGALAREIQAEATISYADIPHFPHSTAISHAGNLVCGTLAGVPVVAMEGRVHSYEGYPFQQITFPVRVMKYLGADLLIVSNACGGMNPQYKVGDVMVIDDHINLLTGNPLMGINDDRLGPRFPDMSRAYTPELDRSRAWKWPVRENFVAHRGVFVAVSGPNLGNSGRISLLPQHRGRLRRHVDGSRMHCRRPRRHARAWPVGHYRRLLSRLPKAGRHQRNSARRGDCGAKAPQNRAGRAGGRRNNF